MATLPNAYYKNSTIIFKPGHLPKVPSLHLTLHFLTYLDSFQITNEHTYVATTSCSFGRFCSFLPTKPAYSLRAVGDSVDDSLTDVRIWAVAKEPIVFFRHGEMVGGRP